MIELDPITTLTLCIAGGCLSIIVIRRLVHCQRRIKDEKRQRDNFDRAVEKVRSTIYDDVEWRGPRGNVR